MSLSINYFACSRSAKGPKIAGLLIRNVSNVLNSSESFLKLVK